MKNTKSRKRISKADWLEKALDVLKNESIDEVKIDRLAKELKVSRSGFYWHFKNRQDLIRSMIEYWEDEFTSVVTTNIKIHNEKPKKRLYRTMKMILENDLTRLEVPIRASAEKDPVAMELVNRVYQKRLDFLRSIFSDLGFEGEDLEMRTHLFVCYHTWEESMFMNLSKTTRAAWAKLRLELLCTPLDKSS